MLQTSSVIIKWFRVDALNCCTKLGTGLVTNLVKLAHHYYKVGMEKEFDLTSKAFPRTPPKLRFTFTEKLVGALMLLSCFKPPASLYVEPADQIDPAKIYEFMRYYGNGLTYYQIEQWFLSQAGNSTFFETYPRLFTICLTSDQAATRTRANEHLRHFEKVLRAMEKNPRKFYEFDNTTDSFALNQTWIQDLSISRINSPEPDMVNMRQWLHIKLTTAKPLKGIIIQTVVGPLGLPFGEFSVEFPCADSTYSSGNANINLIGQTSYCAFRPRAAIDHPAAYVGYSTTPITEFHVHFKWTDITCMETPYVQFVVVAVEDFVDNPVFDVDFRSVLSPVFLNKGFDSKDGSAYPYYPAWENEMNCFMDKAAFDTSGRLISTRPGSDGEWEAIKWAKTDSVYRIQPNEHYDQCVRGVVNTDRDNERFECPPGPFQCDESYSNFDPADVEKKREELATNETLISKCYPCVAPRCGANIGFTQAQCGESNPAVNNTEFLEKLQAAAAGRQHSVLAMFAFFVLIPIGNFVSRFFKEVGTNFLCGNGPWLFIHVGCHIGALVVTWLSIGPVAPLLANYESVFEECMVLLKQDLDKAKNCAYEKSAENPHVVLSVVAFIFQHIVVLFGFFRMQNNFFRLIQVIIHSQLGYLTFFLGAISSIIAAAADPCADAIVFNVLLLIVPILFSFGGVAIDCMTDTRVGINPRRKQWPILEPIKLEGSGPYTLVKWAVLGAMGGLSGLIWLLFMVSQQIAVFGGRDALEGLDSINSSFLENLKPRGIFGECSEYLPEWSKI